MDNNKKVENEVPVAQFTAFSKLTLRLFNDNTFDALEAISYDSDEGRKVYFGTWSKTDNKYSFNIITSSSTDGWGLIIK